MYVNDRAPRITKRDTMGRWVSTVNEAEERKRLKFLEDKAKNEKRKSIICELISLFEVTFGDKGTLIAAAQTLFSQWARQDYKKDLPQARIQIENLMKQNGFEVEIGAWEKVVDERFK